MNIWIKLFLVVIFGLILFELALTYSRFLKRKQIYNVAKQKAIETKKPLMIIGDPDNGATNFVVGRSYDCGNLCVDITGCPKCSNGIKLKVEDYLPTLESNSYVLFHAF